MSDKSLQYTKALSYRSELTTDLDTTKVQFGESMNFWVMGILKGQKLIPRQLYYQNHILVWITVYENWNPRAYCITFRQLNESEKVSSRCFVYFFSSSSCLKLSLSNHCCSYKLRERGEPSDTCQFQISLCYL